MVAAAAFGFAGGGPRRAAALKDCPGNAGCRALNPRCRHLRDEGAAGHNVKIDVGQD